MTGPIDFADITVGMQLTATTSWTATGASSATSATVVAIEQNVITMSNGDVITSPAYADTGTTIDYNLDETAPTPPPPAPALGTIYTDETGVAWQATGTTDSLAMLCIDGTGLDWPGFLDTHPAATLMQDTPIVPLPDPVSPYPTTITPDAARIGMDIRVTVTYDAGGSKIVRGICAWTQSNPPIDDDTPDYIWLILAAGNVFQFNPLADGQTLTVEQMQDWTADPDWGSVNQPEPPIGTIVRSSQGIAWQRIADATVDGPIIDGVGPWYTAGQGLWEPVTQSFIFTTTAGLGGLPVDAFAGPINWIYLWAAAAPFNVQEAV